EYRAIDTGGLLSVDRDRQRPSAPLLKPRSVVSLDDVSRGAKLPFAHPGREECSFSIGACVESEPLELAGPPETLGDVVNRSSRSSDTQVDIRHQWIRPPHDFCSRVAGSAAGHGETHRAENCGDQASPPSGRP